MITKLKNLADIPVLWIINFFASILPKQEDLLAWGQLLLLWLTIFYTVLKIILWLKFHGPKIFKKYNKDKKL
ncbi:MAG: hypothetical protein IPM56_16240 [Ignavibacteriales bacterium]|nr:MAG: hypothetical protein IPM56_16240 [Ignavibacteriales bacterium]